jgi:type I restriction enzyme S subunit
VSLDNISFVTEEVHNEIFCRCDPEKDDILYIKDGATTGIITVNDLDEQFSMLSSVALLKLPEDVYNRLLVLFLRSPFFYQQMRGFMKGAAITRVTLKRMAPALIPLPPLAEQHRIAAKVDELMALCDKLEAAQAKREKRRDRLVAATLHGLNSGDASPAPGTRPTFKDSARFYLNHLPRLTTRPEHIHQLRQTILNLAVRGKLVPQEPNDEPVTGLLQRIDQERIKTAEKDRRAEAPVQELLADELRWSVPPSWGWRGLADLVLFIDYRGKTPTKTDSGIRLITAKNVWRGFINLAPEEFLTEATYDGWMTRGLPRAGDILFTTEAPMGNAATVRLHEKFGLGFTQKLNHSI